MDINMRLHIAVCDDDKPQCDYICALVTRWAKGAGHFAKVKSYSSAEAFLFDYAEDRRINLFLLDIQMKGISGIELAKEIRKNDKTAQIVFITGYTDFLAEGYEVSALHYLMKPVNEGKLYEVLSRAVERLATGARSVLLPAEGKFIRIPEDDILYAEAFSHHVTVYTKVGSYDVNIRMSGAEDLLGEGFFRCHRSYIVNMKRARELTRAAVILDTGAEIPLSRRLYDEAGQLFIKLC